MEVRIRAGGVDTFEGIRSRRVQHEIAKKPIRMRGYRRGDAFLVTGRAADQTYTAHVVPVELADPPTRKLDRIRGRNLPIQQWTQRFGAIYFLLARESRIEIVGKEMDVCVVDRQIAPCGLGHAA